MASNSCVKHSFCLEWTTELPFEHVPRRSPNIFLEGMEWILEFKFEYGRYHLKMHAKKEFDLPKVIIVTTFIYDSLLCHLDQTSKYLTAKGQNFLWNKTTEEIVADVHDVFKDGKLTIICVFHSTDTQVDKSHVSTQTPLDSDSVHLQSLSRDFSTFLKDETFADVKLICADRTFYANRSVLVARSNVFAAIFRNKMADAEGLVHIKDVEPDILELLLEYMYSAKKPDLCEETAYRVYEAADKYAVYGLRRACSDWMLERQTTNNCFHLLILAHEYSDENFKEMVAHFIAEHLEDLNVESWSALKKNYPLLVLSVLEKRCEDSIPGAAKRARLACY